MLNTVNFLVRYWNGPKWLETEHLMTGPLENWTNCPVFKWTILKVKINKNIVSLAQWTSLNGQPFCLYHSKTGQIVHFANGPTSVDNFVSTTQSPCERSE